VELILRVSVPITSVKTTLAKVKKNVLTGGILIALIIMGISWFISRQISLPLEEMKKGAEKIAAGDFDVKVSSGATIETASLADALNQMAHELKQRLNRMNQLEIMRKDFVANVSHELKTPIASIKGASETLEDGALNDPGDAVKFVKMISSNGERLNRIVSDLLSLSKIEQGAESADIKLELFRIKGILNDAVQACEMKSSNNNIPVVQEIVNDISIPAEPQLLEQAVINLLDNAIKYSKNGDEVKLKAEHKKNTYMIHVIDSGPGIPQEHQSRIFERFYRVDKARSRKLGGTGLGLAIVKHIVQLHGGHVSVTSREGQGSRFTINLPDSRKKLLEHTV